ncbi:MAG TPA: sialidase family protein [Solirubrobacteraceae bacterium]|nr:sialidase family protein [Solirubrobacteraceae bacterium]
MRARWLVLAALTVVCPLVGAASALGQGDALVTSGSPSSPFPQNKQNEPAVVIDPVDTSLAVAGANEEIDNAPCNGSDCSFTPGIGDSGVYFSFDGGQSWSQPTYRGLSARTGTPVQNGPIGTVPNYFEQGLVSDGDPTLAFGPRPDAAGKFSWANGARLYYGNLTSNVNAKRTEAFRGAEGVAVSFTDSPTAAAAGQNTAWSSPVVVSKQNSALFSDKPNIWADNAASSPYFGNLYECNIAFRSQHGTPEPVVFSRSTDGGGTFSGSRQLTAAAGNAQQIGRQGCAIRTDSHGTVYVFFEGAVNKQSVQEMTRSTDGGRTFDRPRPVASVVDVGVFDPVQQDIVFDGVTGARTDSFPSVDIANGAPTGAGATNVIAMTWSDARAGLNHEQALVQLSGDGGSSWTTPVNAAAAGDRPDFPAVALAPDGRNLYLVYDGFLSPFQTTNDNPRPFEGVVRRAALTGTTLSAFSTLHRGQPGDSRASSANALTTGFLGDYNYAAATNASVTAVWNDARNAADCPAIDAFRDSELTSNPVATPAPPTQCPPTFGNTDIFGGNYTP